MKEKKKILIADPSSSLLDAITSDKEASHYHITTVQTGPECLKKIKEVSPQLVIMDLLISHIHAIEILKVIKSQFPSPALGVIITSYHPMIQNYQAALEKGANYFLIKPFKVCELFALIALFFQKGLKPVPFAMKGAAIPEESACYHPSLSPRHAYLHFWGTRGSCPVAGPEYVNYGGNTSCLEIRYGKDVIIIDAGTGIRKLGTTIDLQDNQTLHLFISHTHWDHITGFPFFRPLYKKTCNVIVWAPVGFEKSTKELFTSMLAYAYFPVRLDEMKAQVTFKELRDDNAISIGEVVISSHFTNHPGPTLGFKIKVPGKTIGYITDNEVLLGYHGHPSDIHAKHPLLQPHLSLIAFLKGCDLIIHEAQYLPEEYYRKTGWGHSSVSNATVLLKHTGCKHWIVTHHDPNHKDCDLRLKEQLHLDILKECQLSIEMQTAYDGLILPLA